MRTIKLIERQNGVVVRDEDTPASVDFSRTRRGTIAVRYTHKTHHTHKTHREEFASAVKAHGGTWQPGTKEWEIPRGKEAAALSALAADGFEIDRKRALWLGIEIARIADSED